MRFLQLAYSSRRLSGRKGFIPKDFRIRGVLFAALIFLFTPLIAHADAGVPMIYFSFPLQVEALVLVIIIEVLVLVKIVGSSSARIAFAVVAANILTTLIGVPLTWIVMVLLLVALEYSAVILGPIFPSTSLETFWGKFFTLSFGAPWLPAIEDPKYAWIYPVALIILLIPFCIVSIAIEYWIYRKLLREVDRVALWRGAVASNISSYMLLELAPLAWLVTGHRFW